MKTRTAVRYTGLLLFIFLMFSLYACNKQNNYVIPSDVNTDETTEDTIEDTSEDLDLDTEPSTYSTEITMYIISLSASLKATAQYSLSDDGEVLLDTYAFDTNCEYYTADNQSIDFNTFRTIVDDNTANNKRTKCLLEINQKKIVSMVYILD